MLKSAFSLKFFYLVISQDPFEIEIFLLKRRRRFMNIWKNLGLPLSDYDYVMGARRERDRSLAITFEYRFHFDAVAGWLLQQLSTLAPPDGFFSISSDIWIVQNFSIRSKLQHIKIKRKAPVFA